MWACSCGVRPKDLNFYGLGVDGVFSDLPDDAFRGARVVRAAEGRAGRAVVAELISCASRVDDPEDAERERRFEVVRRRHLDCEVPRGEDSDATLRSKPFAEAIATKARCRPGARADPG